MNPDSLCVVVPVYNAEHTLEPLVERLQEVLGDFRASQIVLVDDGSTDRSADKLHALFHRYDNVTVIMLRKNYGQQSALLCGLRECRCDYAAIIDDDLEQNPEDILVLYDAIRKGADVVYGVGAAERGAFRSFGSWLRDQLFDRITDKPENMKVCSFRIMNRATVEQVTKAYTKFVYISLEILKHTTQIANISVRTGERAPSGYRPLRLMRLLFWMYVYYAPCKLLKPFRQHGACYEIGEALRREDMG
jgi:undecaprenyl-phosphate 4-deoxy-4-formamido-L-arabinose transferase